MRKVTIVELEDAINAARSAVPAQGVERSLSEDVDVMATIYGELIFHRHTAFDLHSLDLEVQAVVVRWLPGT